MAYCYVFLDGSGKPHDTKVVGFCGYVATAETWDAFLHSWREKLRRHDLNALHAYEAMHFTGCFEKKSVEWGTDRERMRNNVLLDFIQLIRIAGVYGVGCLTESKLLKPKTTNIGHLAIFQNVLQGALSILGPEDTLSVFVDDEPDLAPQCYKIYKTIKHKHPEIGHKVKSICFGDDDSFAPLQAADLFAYLACQEHIRKIESPTIPISPLFEQLIEKVPGATATVHEFDFWNEHQIAEELIKAKKPMNNRK